tara:strand:- start:129 stop:458 length:330 start_codon:yes stop_codon:yes gene_type:complete
MVDGKVHTSDTHTDFQLLVEKTQVDGTNVVVDLSAFTTKQMVFVDPDGSETTVTATVVNGTGTDGLLRYINNAGALTINSIGLWSYRAKVSDVTSGVYQSNNSTFEVIG